MSGGDHNEGIAQLAVWFTAGLARLSQLSEIAGAESHAIRTDSSATRAGPSTAGVIDLPKSELLPLVVWTIVGHQWKFYVSWQEQSGNMIMLEPWDALNASTLTHMKIWKLLTIVRKVTAWLEEVYWKKFRRDVLERLV